VRGVVRIRKVVQLALDLLQFGLDLTHQVVEVQDLGGAAGQVEALSEREFAVFIQLARGQSVNRIAETLSLSPNTVGTHLYNIKQKLGAANEAELTLIAVRNGLIEA